ncbi:transketolase [Marinivivus vitaminiproducens]|uniref:transketolase n=1 Tax=Marinivivus vitaminiproducens TaxID=3035935 RepID=UPI0027A4681D|nr:transketolase [Geminicoccaceae bacterium SCSIO 64248]
MALAREQLGTLGGTDPGLIRKLALLERRVRWLATWTIHNANHVRPNRDGVKVGGHQASSASLTTVMTALFFHSLRARDRVAVKPHASPVFHAIQYLLGRQELDQLQRFRGLGGAQSYPSRTKDKDDVDFSTGSVGLGVAVTAFAALVQDYLADKGLLDAADKGRMIALLGDAELDEGNIYEALIEACKQDIQNVWWIVDYNRQSLDSVTADRMFDRFDRIFQAAGWEVVTIKYGKAQREAFAKPGGQHLKAWIDTCPNALYAALCYRGGAAWRDRLMEEIGAKRGVRALLESYDDEALGSLMTRLGGHCLETLVETFEQLKDDPKPRLFLAYTVKGYGLPFQGHKDNHAGLMTVEQMEAFRAAEGVAEGEEWQPFAGLDAEDAGELQALLETVPFRERPRTRPEAEAVPVPALDAMPVPGDARISTQAAFGKILHEIGRKHVDLAKRMVTTSPDVTVSTNLGGWVNRWGVYHRVERDDVFALEKVLSPQRWAMGPKGQHIELGIAEHNLFLALAALGLSGPLFGQRLLPVGTVYDPFINRGLDALIYACYQDARFLLVATPSGVTLAPEGGAHQSIGTPVIGMAQPGLTYAEPAYVDELAVLMHWALEHMQEEDGGSVYLRLSTRPLQQPKRPLDPAFAKGVLDGCYWQVPPAGDAKLAIAYTGAVAPEVEAAFAEIRGAVPGAGLLAVPSPDLAHAGWTGRTRPRKTDGRRVASAIEWLLDDLAPDARIVTVLDGAPGTLSWLGSVRGHRALPLGVERFGQTGTVADLYAAQGIDADAIVQACSDVFLPR